MTVPLEKCILAEQRRDIDRAIMLLKDHRVSELLDKPNAGATSEELETKVEVAKALLSLDHVKSNPDVAFLLRNSDDVIRLLYPIV
jgi:hypothetical protein